MPAPEREDFTTPLRDHEKRLDRLERFIQSLGAPAGIYLPDVSPPTTPSNGGIVYVEAGALHYLGDSGTVTVVAPA